MAGVKEMVRMAGLDYPIFTRLSEARGGFLGSIGQSHQKNGVLINQRGQLYPVTTPAAAAGYWQRHKNRLFNVLDLVIDLLPAPDCLNYGVIVGTARFAVLDSLPERPGHVVLIPGHQWIGDLIAARPKQILADRFRVDR